MLNLVFYTDNTLKAEPYTTSEIIANNTNNQHDSIKRLIRKHQLRLEQRNGIHGIHYIANYQSLFDGCTI